MKNRQTTYIIKQRYGMESAGDYVDDYKTPEEITERIERNSAYVEMCKSTGIYGKEYELKLTLMHNSLYDECKIETRPIESFRMTYLNLSND